MEGSAFVLYDSNMRQADGSRIQVYNLFGEMGDLPDVVHCETIAARSALHDWAVSPHRHARLHQILLIEKGGGRASFDGRIVPLGPMRVVNVPVGSVHGFRFTPGTRGWVLTIAAEVLDEVLLASEGLAVVLGQVAVLPASARMRATMRHIFAEFGARDFARAHLLRALTGMLAGLVARSLSAAGRIGGAPGGSDLAGRFQDLLERHYLQHWNVARYAAALAVTPTHLSRVVRGATGHPASQVILNRIVREARRHLVYTNLPISEIAYGLGFKDPAYFSRVFAAATGFSPSRFRERLHKAG